ncbi:MAG: ImmA/IrrE family metallo-endopeptidase [Lachnospiraceae bacterium]
MYHEYTPERLEKKAIEILSIYHDGELLKKPMPMDVDHFAEFYLKATIDFANLSQDGLTLGCTCFNDGILMVWDDERKKEYPIDVKKGYIFIDNKVLEYEVEARVRFTIIHECSHWILHKRFYYQKPGCPIPKINCSVYHIENWSKRPPMSDEDIREWQANRLGAALIMPAPTVEMLMASKLNMSVKGLSAVYVSEQFLQEMAAVFNVSKAAMTKRLRDLDLLLQ